MVARLSFFIRFIVIDTFACHAYTIHRIQLKHYFSFAQLADACDKMNE